MQVTGSPLIMSGMIAVPPDPVYPVMVIAPLLVVTGYAVDDSTPNRQYRELWPKIIRKTNWSSRSGSRPTRLAGSISHDFGGRRGLCVRGASRVRRGEMDGAGRCVRGVSIRSPPRPGPFSKTPARLCDCGSGRLGQ